MNEFTTETRNVSVTHIGAYRVVVYREPIQTDHGPRYRYQICDSALKPISFAYPDALTEHDAFVKAMHLMQTELTAWQKAIQVYLRVEENTTTNAPSHGG